MYDEECLRKERVTQELFEARKTIDGLQLRIAEREKTILMYIISPFYISIRLEQRVYDVELALKEKVGQFEDLRKAADLQNEKHIEELSQRDQEISRLNKVIKDLTKEYEKAGTTLAQLEKLHNEELAHKRVLENETGELTKKIKDLLFRLDENAIEMEKERRDKAIIEAELVACKQREEENSIRMREMRDEIARLKNTIQQSIENEQEKNTRFREEKDYLTATLGQKDAEIDELRRRLAAMEQNLYESEDKNKRLVELLNQEIHKQAEEFKKKALTTLFAPAKRLAENIVNTGLRGDDSSAQLRMEDELEKLRAESEAMKEEEKSKSPLKTEPKPESSPEKLRRIINQEELPKAVKEDYDNYPYPSFPTHKDDKTYGDSSFRGSVIDKTTEEM
jgi:Membrane-bound metallopeptidase